MSKIYLNFGAVLCLILFSTSYSWAQPANDLCAGAIPITPSPQGTGCGTATFNLPFTTDGTTDSGVPTVCSTPGNDHWFTWTATSLGLTFNSESPGDPGIAVFANCTDAAAGTDIACLGTFANGTLSGWTMGQNLLIQIYDFNGSSADVAFCLEEYTPPPAPGNNDCSSPTPVGVNSDLSCTITVSGTINAATASGEDETTCSGTEDDDVWFSFVATATSHEIDLINVANGTTDLYHSVWSGSCGALTNILCSDPNSSTASGLTIGTTYLLRVYSWTSTSGQTTTFDVCIGTLPPPPANDACAGAISVSAGAAAASGSTAASTNVEGLTACSGGSTCGGGTGGIDFGAGLWFVYNSTGPEELTFDTDGSDFDTEIQVFEGSCGSLTCVGGDDDSGAGTQSSICFASTASFAPVDYYIYVDGHGTNNGNFVLNVGTAPLPIELLSFNGKSMDDGNKLTWATSTEINTEYHVIERSLNGQNGWAEIGRVEAAGSSFQTLEYSFMDDKPLAKGYYRLVTIDLDKSEQLSEVLSLEREDAGFTIATAFPNPTNDYVAVQYHSPKNVQVEVKLMDISGKILQIYEVDANDGVNNLDVNLSELAAGTYFLSLSNSIDKVVERLIKH